jgi:hypothetical protein
MLGARNDCSVSGWLPLFCSKTPMLDELLFDMLSVLFGHEFNLPPIVFMENTFCWGGLVRCFREWRGRVTDCGEAEEQPIPGGRRSNLTCGSPPTPQDVVGNERKRDNQDGTGQVTDYFNHLANSCLARPAKSGSHGMTFMPWDFLC